MCADDDGITTPAISASPATIEDALADNSLDAALIEGDAEDDYIDPATLREDKPAVEDDYIDPATLRPSQPDNGYGQGDDCVELYGTNDDCVELYGTNEVGNAVDTAAVEEGEALAKQLQVESEDLYLAPKPLRSSSATVVHCCPAFKFLTLARRETWARWSRAPSLTPPLRLSMARMKPSQLKINISMKKWMMKQRHMKRLTIHSRTKKLTMAHQLLR